MAETLGLAFVKKEIQLQNNLIGSGFADPPSSGKSRVSYTGEIVSAIGFGQSRLSINYKVHLPDQWNFDDFNSYDTLGYIDDLEEINKRDSITQWSTATVIDYRHEKVYESSFSFPFDLQFIHDNTVETSDRPYLLFQVNSLDSWDRHRIEGYGALQFPSTEGSHEFRVQTWKPRGSFYNEVHSFFLGGSVMVIELEDIIQSYKVNEKGERQAINRSDFETEDSGEILIRLNCISHDYDRKMSNREKYEIEREKQEQEIVRRINAERVKQIKKYRKQIQDEIAEEEELVSDYGTNIDGETLSRYSGDPGHDYNRESVSLDYNN